MKKIKTEKYSAIWSDGKVMYCNKKGYHRLYGPAEYGPHGGQAYYKNGVLHRDYGPAEIDYNGGMAYRKKGRLHRKGGPAMIWRDSIVKE